MPPFTIGGLARAAGVGVETVRFYQRKRLLEEPERRSGGVRRYGAEHAARIRFIKAAQRLGFSLSQTHSLLRLDDGVGCAEARRLGEEKLAIVRERLSQLKRVESVLSALVRECARRRGKVRCPLVSALEAEGELAIEGRPQERPRLRT